MTKAQIELEKFINTKGKIKFFGEKKVVTEKLSSNVSRVLNLMDKRDRRVILITGDDRFRLRGIVVCGDICRILGGGETCLILTDPKNCFKRIYEQPISSVMTSAIVKINHEAPLFVGVQVMTEQNIGTLPLIDRDGDLVGIITERHIAFLLAETNIEVKVRDLMTTDVITCTSKCNILQTLKITCGKGFRRLPIMEEGQLIGYLTVKDIIRYFTRKKIKEFFKNEDLDAVFNESVTSIMTSPVITIHPDASVTELAKLLKKHNIGAVPVVENDKLVGIITERDIVTAMAIPPFK